MTKQAWFDLIFPPAAILTLCWFAWRFDSGALVLLCTILGFLGCIFNGNGKKYCYFFSLASSLMYAFISLSNKYYGEAILHFALISPLYIYSLLRWFRPRERKKKTDIYRLNARTAVLLCLALAAGSALYGCLLSRMGSSLPYLNALATAVTTVANFLSARRMREQWYANIVTNGVLITLWLLASGADTGNLPLLVQNILFVICNIRGMILWRRMDDAQDEREDTPVPGV